MEQDVYLGLDGRAALVTGAATGAGRAIARWLARAGCDVAVVDTDRDAAEQVAEQLREHDFTAIAVGADGRSPDGVAAMIEAVLDQFDALDVAVNDLAWHGAGALGARSKAALDALTACCRAEAQAMLERSDGGVVLNFALADPESSEPDGVVKRLAALTTRLARELAGGIRVNALVGDRFVPDDPAEAGSPPPIEARDGAADDFGRAAVFFASSLARNVTGQVLRVDGARSLRPKRGPDARR